MAPSTRSNSTKKATASSTLKQNTLSFTSQKRSVSGRNIKAKKPSRTKSNPAPAILDDVEDIRSSSPVEDAIEDISAKSVRSSTSDIDSAPEEDLESLLKTPRLRKHWSGVQKTMGWIQPIHPEGKTRAERILHVFDLSYEYGPCIGVKRLDRWKRAEAEGLNPPTEVRDILLTLEAGESPALFNCIFEGEV
ncbi:hypothetical protein HGRIS_005107 [Hohenbuehelia grisea]|uniref:DNA polymerase delta subunit 4 n=1 Tax=Hohenbuehelia grisea TaxID=104357 RepID=A0ABR3JEG1_9AGAR